MTFEIDHIFILTSRGAPEAEKFAALGLIEGSRNTHPSQGTANRRFFFRNAMIELLWVEDEREAASNPLGLGGRWKNRATTSPFGVLLRPRIPGPAEPPFVSWEYRPSAMPDLVAHIAKDLSGDEPFWGYLPGGSRQDAATSEPMEHSAGMRELTAVALTLPQLAPESVTARLLACTEGPAHLLSLTFDAGAQSCVADLRPDLPLVLRW